MIWSQQRKNEVNSFIKEQLIAADIDFDANYQMGAIIQFNKIEDPSYHVFLGVQAKRFMRL